MNIYTETFSKLTEIFEYMQSKNEVPKFNIQFLKKISKIVANQPEKVMHGLFNY